MVWSAPEVSPLSALVRSTVEAQVSQHGIAANADLSERPMV